MYNFKVIAEIEISAFPSSIPSGILKSLGTSRRFESVKQRQIRNPRPTMCQNVPFYRILNAKMQNVSFEPLITPFSDRFLSKGGVPQKS